MLTHRKHLQSHLQPRLSGAFVPALAIALGAALLPVTAQALTLPPVYTHQTVTYVSGGIGLDESTAMKAAAPQFPLELMFVRSPEAGSRAYSADNVVTILDARGNTILNTSADGPYMLVDLQPGRYTVIAEDQGRHQLRTAYVSPLKHERIVFQW